MLRLELHVEGHELAFLSTITMCGAARDITVQELSIETLYPADAATRETLQARPWATSTG